MLSYSFFKRKQPFTEKYTNKKSQSSHLGINWVHPGFVVRNSYASKFQYIRIILIKLIRYISSIAPK